MAHSSKITRHDESDDETIYPYRTLYKDGYVREFFRSNVPSDLYDSFQENYEGEMRDYAIYQTREQASTYRIPCNWQVLRWEGEDAIVLRTARMTQEEIQEHGH